MKKVVLEFDDDEVEFITATIKPNSRCDRNGNS